jgi:hypothetical protein
MIKKRRLLGISLVRRSTRRWLVIGYWAVVLTLVGFDSQLSISDASPLGLVRWLFVIILSSPGFLGGTVRNEAVREFDGPTADEPDKSDYTFMTTEDIAAKKREKREMQLDERDTMLRNAIHYRAYAFLRKGASFVFVVNLALRAPNYSQYAHFQEPLLVFVFLVFMSLPQSMIIWTEPDMEEVQ